MSGPVSEHIRAVAVAYTHAVERIIETWCDRCGVEPDARAEWVRSQARYGIHTRQIGMETRLMLHDTVLARVTLTDSGEIRTTWEP